MLKIINVYDKKRYNNQFIADWGFGCIIEHPNAKIIFDTGAKPEILEKHLKLAQIDPLSIDIIVIAHKHWGHKGGALWLVKRNLNVKICLSKTWRNGLEKSLAFYAIAINSITKHLPISCKAKSKCKNLFVTELVLTKKTSNGLITYKWM